MKKAIVNLIIVLLAVIQVFPLVWLANFSLLKNSEFFGTVLLKWPQPFKWKNYADAFKYGKVPQFFLNSVFVTGMTIVLTVVLSLFLAYALTRMQWKWKTGVMSIVLLGIIIPLQTTLLSNFILFKQVGILNTYMALIFPGVAFSIPLSTLIFTGFLRSIPREVEEVAVIDGLNLIQVVLRIVYPLTLPAIATVAVMVFLGSWGDYINPLTFISSDSLKTLPFSVIQFQGRFSSNYGAQFAVLTLIALPSIVAYLLFSKQITRGMLAGALKG